MATSRAGTRVSTSFSGFVLFGHVCRVRIRSWIPDSAQSASARRAHSATLHFDVECVTIGAGKPQPNIFSDIDADSDAALTAEEIETWFQSNHQRASPPELMDKEDKDKDGKVSWEEFSGPKGDAPPSKEDL